MVWGLNMGSFSIWHWIVVLLIVVLYVLPALNIVRKAGYSGWRCLLMLIPVVNVVAYWVFAFAKWPVLQSTRTG